MDENNFYLENCVFSINSHTARVGQSVREVRYETI